VGFPLAHALTLKAREEMIEAFDQLLGIEEIRVLILFLSFFLSFWHTREQTF